MKRFNFGTFLVDDSNRRAFQLCYDIAELKPVSPLPVVLLGDEGCGKTHLLYSIVNRIRAGTTKTGLAYVTAVDFPDQVRQLIDDPSPVERAQSAVLLVDQLDRFTDLIDELEAVVRIFLDHHHYVVLATKVHPGRLQNLSPGFREIIDAGQIVQIVPRGVDSQIESIKRQLREETDAQLITKQQEIDQLRALLNRVGKDSSPEAPANVAALRAELEAERIAKADMSRKLAEAREVAENARDQLARYSGAAPLDVDRQNEQATRIAELERLADALREEANQARLEASENLETAKELHEQLEQIRAEAAKHVIAAGEAQESLERAETETSEAFARAGAMENEIEIARAALVAEQQTVQELRACTEKYEAEIAEARQQIEQIREELEQARSANGERGAEFEQLRGLLDQTRGEAAAAHNQFTTTQEQLESTSLQLAEAENEAQSLRTQLEQAREEIAGLRAAMGDNANLERELADVKTALDDAREDAQRYQRERDEFEAQVNTLTGQLHDARTESSAIVERMETALAQLASVRARDIEQREEQRRKIDELEALLEAQSKSAVQPDVLAAVKAQAENAVNQIDALRNEFERERSDLSAAHEAARSEYEAQIQALRQDLSSTRTEAEHVDAEREALHVELERIKHEMESTRAQIDELVQARESAAASYLEAERDREQLRAASEQEREQRMKFQTEAAKLRAERDAARTKFEQLEQTLNERAAELDSIKHTAAEAQAVAGELQGRIAKLETEREGLKQTARNLQAQMENVANNLMQSGQAFFAALGGGNNNPSAPANTDNDQSPQSGNFSSKLSDIPGESWGPGGVSVLRPLEDLQPFDEEGSERDI